MVVHTCDPSTREVKAIGSPLSHLSLLRSGISNGRQRIVVWEFKRSRMAFPWLGSILPKGPVFEGT